MEGAIVTVSSVGRVGIQHHLAAQAASPRLSAAKDADGDRDGTKPGRVDLKDGATSGHAVDVRA